MAKTAEEKAAIKAEKEAEKAERRAEKDQVANLKSAQQAEVMAYREALSDSGLSNKEIKALIREEKAANKQELFSAKETLSEDGLQYIGRTATRPDGSVVRGPIVSDMETIGAEYQKPIVDDIRGALSFYSDYNLPKISRRGNAELGIGLDDILKMEYSRDPVTGEYTKTGNLAKTITRAQDFVNNTFTADELIQQGARLKQDKNNPGLFTWKFGDDERKGYIFFKDNGDGTFTGLGANRMAIDAPDSGPLGGLFKAVPYLPEIAAIGASLIPGGQAFAPEIYAAGKGLQTASGGGDFGDILKSAGMAYAGSTLVPGAVKSVLPANIASIPGVTQGVSRSVMGALSGQDIDDALLSGLASGAGGYTSSGITGATGSQGLGRAGGALTSAAISGGNVKNALGTALTSQAVQSGLNQVAPMVTEKFTDPSIRRIAENSLTKIVGQGLSRGTSRPAPPIPVPGVVRRQFASQPPKLIRPMRFGGLTAMKGRK